MSTLTEKIVSSTEIISELERSYEVLNDDIFNGKLPNVPFVFNPRQRGRIRYIPDSGHMNIGSEMIGFHSEPCDLQYVSPELVLASLLHEMCHVYNVQKGIDDTTSNEYHNRKFMSVATAAGFWVVEQKTTGWSATSLEPPFETGQDVSVPTDSAVERRQRAFKRCDLSEPILRKTQELIYELVSKVRRKKLYFMKYSCNCPPPHNSIRSGRRPAGPHRLNIICMDCKRPFHANEAETVNSD